MVRRSVPASSRWVAKLCRRVWTVTCLPKPGGRWAARTQTLCTGLGGDGPARDVARGRASRSAGPTFQYSRRTASSRGESMT